MLQCEIRYAFLGVLMSASRSYVGVKPLTRTPGGTRGERDMRYQMPMDKDLQVIIDRAHHMRNEAMLQMFSDVAGWLGQLFAPLPKLIKN